MRPFAVKGLAPVSRRPLARAAKEIKQPAKTILHLFGDLTWKNLPI
jgi:hypothetical protein